MADLVFQALDGLQVTLEDRRYRYHISPKHPDISVEDIREALTQPVRICNHERDLTAAFMKGRREPIILVYSILSWSWSA